MSAVPTKQALSARNGKPDREAGTQSHGAHEVSRATEIKEQ
jgi:hypothetical protein